MMDGKTSQACIFHPGLGKFVQPDTIIPNPANPQSFNRYSYVYNSPIMYTDPTGNMPQQNCVDDGFKCFSKGGGNTGVHLSANQDEQNNDFCDNFPDHTTCGGEGTEREQEREQERHRELVERASNFSCPTYVSLEACANTIVPEYFTITVTGILPIFGALGIGLHGSIILDRYGNIYLAGVSAAGTSGLSVALVGGNMVNLATGDSSYYPSQEQIEGFLAGTYQDTSGGIIMGVGNVVVREADGVLPRKDVTSYEAGIFFSPGASINAGESIMIHDNHRTIPLWGPDW